MVDRYEFSGEEARHAVAVYLAGPWDRRAEYIEIADEIEATGMYVVVSRWLSTEVSKEWSGADPYFRGYSRWQGTMDIADVSMAGLCVFDMRGLDDKKPRHGTHVELGAALAFSKPIWIVGERNHVFHYCPGIAHFETMDDAVDELLGKRADDL